MSAEDIIIGALGVAVLIYLFWALLNPERL